MTDKAINLMVVSDDPAVIEKFEQSFSGTGYKLITATGGEDALWKLNNGNYDAVFTGSVLPGISGLELVESVHVSRPEMPIVVFTESGSGADDEISRNAGATEILHHPLSPKTIADTAERVLKATDSAAASQEVEEASSPANHSLALRLKNTILFILGPFVSLLYLLFFPVIGLGMLIHMAIKAKEQKSEKATPKQSEPAAKTGILKSIAMMISMAISGVFYGVFVPILGIGLVLWFVFQAWAKLGAKAIGPGQTK